MEETNKRSLVKAITWSVVGAVLLSGLMYLLTGNYEQTTLIIFLYYGIRVLIYYCHERVWLKIKWGTS